MLNHNNIDDLTYEKPFEAASIARERAVLQHKHTRLHDIAAPILLDTDRTNPQSPLHSVKSFEELKLEPQLLQGIYAMGFRRPSRIQERALPQLLAYPPRNMIAQSQNGTGKTVNTFKVNSGRACG